MTSLFNDNENIACESCGKVIMREMSFCSVMTPLNNLSNKIEILYDDQNQPWFKRAHVGKFLDLSDIHKSLDKLKTNVKCAPEMTLNQPGVILQVGLDPKINKKKLTFFCQFMV